jgi:DNA-dependent protein kinase catalytic subunit
MLPSDLLIKVISSLSSSADSFLILRSKFARSFCTLSMVSYILGIGDRHLENFLLDCSDGTLVGIDFGASFGQGIQLGVPELMPFRFTRQFRSILQPLDTMKILKQDMTYTLTALRNKKHMLLTVMDVFVKEPQLDWLQLARNAATEGQTDRDDLTWFPAKRIAVARKKLLGQNPATIMIEELKGKNICAQRNEHCQFSICFLIVVCACCCLSFSR